MEPIVEQFLHTSPLSAPWRAVLGEELEQPYFAELCRAVQDRRSRGTVFPPEAQVFAALNLTAPEDVRCVILGQDPYHEQGQAHGLAFSVCPGVPLPRSLCNIYKERESDLGIPPAQSGSLLPWAEQGVLLLNTVLTVDEGQANSHAKFGWQTFTDAVFRILWQQPQPMAFILWGNQARQKLERAGCGAACAPRLTVTSAHPSPLSASRGFFGSRPFSRVNAFLLAQNCAPIRWET